MPNKLFRIGRRPQIAHIVRRVLRGGHDVHSQLLTSRATVNWRVSVPPDPIEVSAADSVWVVDADHGREIVTTALEVSRRVDDFRVMVVGQRVPVPWYHAEAALTAARDLAGRSSEDLRGGAGGIGFDVGIASAPVLLGGVRGDVVVASEHFSSTVGRASERCEQVRGGPVVVEQGVLAPEQSRSWYETVVRRVPRVVAWTIRVLGGAKIEGTNLAVEGGLEPWVVTSSQSAMEGLRGVAHGAMRVV